MSENTKKHIEPLNDFYEKPEQAFIKPHGFIDTSDIAQTKPIENKPGKIVRYIKFSELSGNAKDLIQAEQRNAQSIQQVLMLLQFRLGHDFTSYKKATITSRINRRLAFHKLADYTQYAAYLYQNPAELELLFNELLIGATRFFRDPQAFESLGKHLIQLIKLKKDNEPLRIWIAGCSTGEEAYSIAMLAIECIEQLKKKPECLIQIFATDLDNNAIEFARAGLYHANEVASISEKRLKKLFEQKDDMYQVKKEVRNLIVFAQHNLIKDAPFTRLDLLCCRNVMIYFTAELQKKIVPILHYALNNTGLIFTGLDENISDFTTMFSPADEKWKIFTCKNKCNTFTEIVTGKPNANQQIANINSIDEQLQKLNSPSAEIQTELVSAKQQLNIAIKEIEMLITKLKLAGHSKQLVNGETTNYTTSNELERLNTDLNNLLNTAGMEIMLLSKQLEILRFEREKAFTSR